MKNKFKLSDGCIGCLAVLLILFVSFGSSWLFTCGLLYFVTLCFGWKFSWAAATGIWLISMFVFGYLKTGK